MRKRFLILSIVFGVNTLFAQKEPPFMPPQLEIIFDNMQMVKDSLLNNYDFYIQHINGRVPGKNTQDKVVDFKSTRYTRISNDRLLISLQVNDGPYKQVFPEKGSIIGFYLKDKKANTYMRLFFRICRDLYRKFSLSLKGLSFKEGCFFYDMCSSIAEYGVNFNYLCPDKIEKEYYVINHFLDLGDCSAHKISVKKLNKLIKKYKCNG